MKKINVQYVEIVGNFIENLISKIFITIRDSKKNTNIPFETLKIEYFFNFFSNCQFNQLN